jgi:hypothetical protein
MSLAIVVDVAAMAGAAMTFIEPSPIGLLVSVVSAAILRKKRSPAE